MEGQVDHELKVGLSATKIWDVYGGLKIGQLCPKLAPTMVQKVDVLEGDGGVGTILSVEFAPGKRGFTSWKEKFIRIDDVKRVKEVELIEGGLLDLGFSFFGFRFEIIETDANSCVIKSVINYKADTTTNASIVTTQGLESFNNAIVKYLLQSKTSEKQIQRK